MASVEPVTTQIAETRKTPVERKCSLCKQKGHNKRSCKLNKTTEQEEETIADAVSVVSSKSSKKSSKKTTSPPTQTIAEIQEKLLSIVGREYLLPVTNNKGRPGLYLEELLDIPHSSNHLDCVDGEVKTFPVKKIKKTGEFAPKETIAITMLSLEEFVKTEYSKSLCYAKMKKMLVVPYYRVKTNITFLKPTLIDLTLPMYAKLYSVFESDYNEIQKQYIETKILESQTGILLQNRTKGAGHGSTSRAFYLRTEFIRQYVAIN